MNERTQINAVEAELPCACGKSKGIPTMRTRWKDGKPYYTLFMCPECIATVKAKLDNLKAPPND